MKTRNSYDWSLTSKEELARMYLDEGRSGSQIANRLGHGLTHSAVMGRLDRLGIKKGNNLTKKAAQEPRQAVRAPRKPSRPPRKPEPAAPLPLAPEPIFGRQVGLIESIEAAGPGLCRAPLASPTGPEFAYCNAAATQGDYCALHTSLFYQTPAERRRRN
jgi:GcrA cell cycle regulator